jgi:predicted DNA-binding transcriptional regulator YafY
MHKGKQTIQEVLFHGLTIVNTLLQHAPHKLTRRQLADKTGLRPKQVWRYLNTLEEFHFPLQRQCRAQEELVWVSPELSQDNKWLRRLPFTLEEVTALAFYTALAESVGGTPLQANMQAVQEKIARTLRHDEVQQVTRGFMGFARHVKPYGDPAVQKKLALALSATVAALACRVTYRRPQAQRTRTYVVHPYTLCAYDGGLYWFVYVPYYDEVIVQSIERIRYVAVLEDTPFVKRADIWQRIESKRARAFGLIDDGEVLEVALKFSAAQAPYVRERLWHPTQQFEPLPDGALILRLQASGRFEIRRWVLGWGDQVEVLAPPCLRAEVAASLRTVVAQYAAGEPVTGE